MSLLFRGLLESIIPAWKPRNILIGVTLVSLLALLLFGRAGQNEPLTETAWQQNTTDQIVTFRDDQNAENGQQPERSSLTSDPAAAQPEDAARFEPALAEPDLQIVRQPELEADAQLTVNTVLVDSYRRTDNIAALLETNSQSEPQILPNVDLERLVIPAIELDVQVTELGWHTSADEEGLIFSEWDVADNAAGWHKNSARPGEGGNVVMSGHNNIFGAVFRELDQLDRGDEVLVYSEGGVHSYKIDSVMVVPETFASPDQRAENAEWIEHFDDDRLTLVSCWPRDDNSHRIIVVGYATGVN